MPGCLKNMHIQLANILTNLLQTLGHQAVKNLTNREEYRLRVGTYRILYVIDDESETITVHRVKHRREAYR